MPTVTEILAEMGYGPAPESDKEARLWAARGPFGQFIGGQFTAPERVFACHEPATGAVLAEVSAADGAQVAQAVEAARAALPSWQALGGAGRARFLYALARGLQRRERLFATLEALNTGKPLREARDGDIPLAIRHFYHHAALANSFTGQGVGVCGQIIPWNFPVLMAAWKLAPALAAGNTVVLKPAEQTPLTALLLAEICQEIGLPAGVVNIVTGGPQVGQALAQAPLDKLAFTGSTEVGRSLAAQTTVPLTLELGGKSAFLVTESADLDAAVEGVVESLWLNAGQVCSAGTRILLAESVAARFLPKLKARMARLTCADPMDKGSDLGAIISPVQYSRIAALVAQAVAEGAEPYTAPEHAALAAPYYPPTLLMAEPANVAWQEEIFGPVATVTLYRTLDDAVSLANASRYGLAASIWAERLTEALDLAKRVKAGVVWVNCANQFDAAAPFGGVRESGYGREGGPEGLAAYMAEPPRAAPEVWPGLETLPAPQEAQALDQTFKMLIGAGQKRAEGGGVYRAAHGLVPAAGRKDLRNAVEAAQSAAAWAKMSGHQRAQVLWYGAESLAARAAEFAGLCAPEEVAACGTMLQRAAAMADTLGGRVPPMPAGQMVLTSLEPFGVLGCVAPEARGMAGLLAMVLPALAMGNRVVALASTAQAVPALRLAQLLLSADLPAGALNLLTGARPELARTLAAHDDVAGLWLGGDYGAAMMGELATLASGNLKPLWRTAPDESLPEAAFLRMAQLKTIWLPYGA